MQAPVAGAASSAPPNTMALMGGGASPDPSGMMADTIQKIRAVGQSVDDLGASNPAFADGVGQIKQILRQMIISAAQQASVQTPSSAAAPTVG